MNRLRHPKAECQGAHGAVPPGRIAGLASTTPAPRQSSAGVLSPLSWCRTQARERGELFSPATLKSYNSLCFLARAQTLARRREQTQAIWMRHEGPAWTLAIRALSSRGCWQEGNPGFLPVLSPETSTIMHRRTGITALPPPPEHNCPLLTHFTE